MTNKEGVRKLERGAAAVELALLFPLLIALSIIAAELGWLMANSVMLMNATSSGLRFFASQRGAPLPYINTNAQIKASAAYLIPSRISYSTSIGNIPCSTDDSCALGLNDAVIKSAVTSAKLTVTYHYQPLVSQFVPGLTDVFPRSLSATVSGRVL